MEPARPKHGSRYPRSRAMVKRPFAPFRLLMRLFFDPEDLQPEDVDKIRIASKQGTVVYVLNHSHFFDFLFFSWVFKYTTDLNI